MSSLLIVDDEDEILNTLKNHFLIEDIECTTCNNAKEAIELHKKNLYPVILSDICMPEINGVEFMHSVKKTHPTCIIFIMTGYTTVNNLLECLENGVSDFFTKPFDDMKFLTQSIKAAFERHKRWQKTLIKVMQDN